MYIWEVQFWSTLELGPGSDKVAIIKKMIYNLILSVIVLNKVDLLIQLLHICKPISSKLLQLAREEEVTIPGNSSLILLGKTIIENATKVRYEFELSGPPHMVLFIQPLKDVKVDDWSFIRNMLDEPEEYTLPYQIFFSYGKDNTPLKFHIDFVVS